MSKRARILLILLVIMIVVCAVLGVYTVMQIKHLMENPEQAFIASPVHENDVVISGDKIFSRNSDIVNILLIGRDSDSVREERHAGERGDMLMLCSINIKTAVVTMLSIPRDTYVEKVYKLDSDGEVISASENKINAAYSWGGGTSGHGAENQMRVVSEFLSCGGQLNVPIDYYFSIDMDGIIELCDALGGVEVTLEEDCYGLQGEWMIGKKGETVTLSGRDANAFVRERHSYRAGDAMRVKHQQQFMMAVAKKIKNMGAVSAAPALYDKFMKFADTNLSLDQAVALAGLLNKMDLSTISFNSLDGNGGYIHNGSTWVLFVDEDDVYNKVTELLYREGA